MSRKRPASDGKIQLTILTSAGSKEEIEINPSKSLKELKEQVSSMASLGSIPSTYQRVFYLGKELKNGGRSLEALGVGRHGINVIHVHNNKPREGYPPHPPPANRRRTKTARKTVMARNRQPIEVVDLATDDDDDEEIVVEDDNDEVCIIDVAE